MAKISARGCYELARYNGPIVTDEKSPDVSWQTVMVLRSDGTVLMKTKCRHRPGERWQQGTYTTHHRLSLVRKGEKWRALDRAEKERRMGCLDEYLAKRGYSKGEIQVW